jgi:hypothetical protein
MSRIISSPDSLNTSAADVLRGGSQNGFQFRPRRRLQRLGFVL